MLDPPPVDPGPVRRRWARSGLVALAILVPMLGLSIPGFAITLLLGYAMVFAGPVYAVFSVPIAVRKWLREEADESGDDDAADTDTDADTVSAVHDLAVGFGALHQKLTMILSVILSVNLMVFVVSYLTNGNSDLMIPCGMIAVAVGVPIFVLNLIWIGGCTPCPRRTSPSGIGLARGG
ncbi:MAG: hypothetical protein LH624_14860 [Cryobacterium sp.]|nr:hypothetical protein [Cryobacterium sp.]